MEQVVQLTPRWCSPVGFVVILGSHKPDVDAALRGVKACWKPGTLALCARIQAPPTAAAGRVGEQCIDSCLKRLMWVKEARKENIAVAIEGIELLGRLPRSVDYTTMHCRHDGIGLVVSMPIDAFDRTTRPAVRAQVDVLVLCPSRVVDRRNFVQRLLGSLLWESERLVAWICSSSETATLVIKRPKVNSFLVGTLDAAAGDDTSATVWQVLLF